MAELIEIAVLRVTGGNLDPDATGAAGIPEQHLGQAQGLVDVPG
jgi:hypothetical protein